MTLIEENLAVAEQSTFGRDGAMFEGLLGFVAQLSVALWSLVILTAVIRFVGMRIYRNAAARKALVEHEATPSAAVPAAHVPAHAAHGPAVPAARVPAHAAHVPSAHAAHAPAPALTADSVEA